MSDLRPQPEPSHRASRPARPVRVHAGADPGGTARPALGLSRATPEAARCCRPATRTELCIATPGPQGRTLVRPTLVGWPRTAASHPSCCAAICDERQDESRHAFRVASGLDSLVLGEAQILGQMKQALARPMPPACWALARTSSSSAEFSVAKRMRRPPRDRRLDLQSPSPRCAWPPGVQDSSRIRIVFVGAGEMIELAATHFATEGAAPASPSPTARSSAAKARRAVRAG